MSMQRSKVCGLCKLVHVYTMNIIIMLILLNHSRISGWELGSFRSGLHIFRRAGGPQAFWPGCRRGKSHSLGGEGLAFDRLGRGDCRHIAVVKEAKSYYTDQRFALQSSASSGIRLSVCACSCFYFKLNTCVFCSFTDWLLFDAVMILPVKGWKTNLQAGVHGERSSKTAEAVQARNITADLIPPLLDQFSLDMDNGFCPPD